MGDNTDLPPGWEACTSKSEGGRTYYANRMLRVTQWDRPSGPSTRASAASARASQGPPAPAPALTRSRAPSTASNMSDVPPESTIRRNRMESDTQMLRTVGDAQPGSKEFAMVLTAVNDDMAETHTRWKRRIKTEIAAREKKDQARRMLVPQHQKQLVDAFPNYPYNNFPYKPRGGQFGRSEWPIPGMQGGFMLYRRPPFGESPALCAPYETTQSQWYPGFNPKREFVYRARSYKSLNDAHKAN